MLSLVIGSSVWFAVLSVLVWLLQFSEAYRYDLAYVDYNLNQNQLATTPLEYWGEWTGHNYTASPRNWRFPFYTIFLDRFVNGDPRNDNINGTAFEHDPNSNQMRHGGDLEGLIDTLDYLQGMGIRGLYLAGSPFINFPWEYDQFGPLDLTILEPHFGTIATWRKAVDEIHARDMYVVLDNTIATLGDLIGFEGYLNTTSPFTLEEHRVLWKSDRHYWDFNIGNTYNETCDYPRFWNETGFPIDAEVRDRMQGCYDSEFDQYGDTEAFGVFPDWRRELSKFASVQDRLREWHAPVRHKIEHFYCILIAQLDIDGYRYDKATQATVDALGSMSDAMRKCAMRYGKENFFLPGEITGGNTFASIFIGRGRQPDMLPENLTQAIALTNQSLDDQYFIREKNYGALDAGAFHYTVYRTLTRFLGMDGNLAAGYDAPLNWVDMWNTMLMTNDLININTGEFDVRHMYGVGNFDVFRWPAIHRGIERQLLGHFITSLLMPGMPLLNWGEEQAFYVLDNTDSNYIFGRQPMSSATAWQMHGCYHLDSTQYFQMPLTAARHGCTDDSVSLDHRDPSAPVRNIIRHMLRLREDYPVLRDGAFLQQLSNQTENVYYPGSSGIATETGMWSVLRSGYQGVQNISGTTTDTNYIWLLYSNLNETRTWNFDCEDDKFDLNSTALISPYTAGTIVKNLLHPFDEQTLVDSKQYLGLNVHKPDRPQGCLNSLFMKPYDYRAYVPIEAWIAPQTMITKFAPGHDARILSKVARDQTEDVEIHFQFSTEMDCESVTNSISFSSSTNINVEPQVDLSTVNCGRPLEPYNTTLVGAIQSTWVWSATLTNVANGVHAITVDNASTIDGKSSSNTRDRFLFRIGQSNNPMIFQSANYSTTLLSRMQDGNLRLNHSAPGADLYRYSTNFASTFSDWAPFVGGMDEIEKQPWQGTSLQAWKGEHVRVEYFSRLAGSSAHVQQADLDFKYQRRFPHIFLNGPYNAYGYDAGLNNEMKLVEDHTWALNWMVEWSPNGSVVQANIWGINPDGMPDQSFVLGKQTDWEKNAQDHMAVRLCITNRDNLYACDIDGDSILDRMPPSALAATVLNVTSPPPLPHLAWKWVLNDGDMRFQLIPSGSMWMQIILYVLLWSLPIVFATLSAWAFAISFYRVRANKIGITIKRNWVPFSIRRRFKKLKNDKEEEINWGDTAEVETMMTKIMKQSQLFLHLGTGIEPTQHHRRTVLIATMEYNIEDWDIKIKIGGLGVMSGLMGQHLGHQDLVWVVPCVGGIQYPVDQKAESMVVTILGKPYEVAVQYHKLRNITFVVLDAPIFRTCTKENPYPPRMDDMHSAVYYSAWNQCIAQALTRFPIDLYHINDYHGTVAPLYLLPKTMPACLSLHNAEFQGLWPMRTREEIEEVCSVFNLPWTLVKQYVQFGEVFNLLHAGASYLRIHQQGYGAVGVSKKYGKRAFMRYPILWGLKRVQGLPNPDPSDTGDWDKKLPKLADISVDSEFEVNRIEWRKQAQAWAGLIVDPEAELFVFVGRWSMQKGVDLIADVFPAILDSNPRVQLICVGPKIDLHGAFAATKLDRMMELYPGRVFSKPEFTALPPYIFSGAEFALIPSRDEPFGLVAVEFGRKGALGVGARVGGLGNMPGWWFTVESMTTQHLLAQFKLSIRAALSCSTEMRAIMRARSAKQRFPVAQWVEDLEILQSTSIRIYNKTKTEKRLASPSSPDLIDLHTPRTITPVVPSTDVNTTSYFSNLASPPPPQQRGVLNQQSSLGTADGPGHVDIDDCNDGRPESATLPYRYSLPPLDDFDSGSIRRDLSGYTEPESNLSRQCTQHCPPKLDNEDIEPDLETSSVFDIEDDGAVHMARPMPLEAVHMARPMSLIAMRANLRNSSMPSLTHGSRSFSGHSSLSVSRPPTLSNLQRPAMPARIFSESDAQDCLRCMCARCSCFSSQKTLCVEEIVEGKTDFCLQKVDPFFTDSNGIYHRIFQKKLKDLSATNSETSNCIEEYLVDSEKEWFNTFRNAKLGISKSEYSVPASIMEGVEGDEHSMQESIVSDEFLLGSSYSPPKGFRKWLSIRVGDWPIYAILLGLGQIMAANSYQITLLTGEVGQTATKLYIIASIYLAASAAWWMCFRRYQSVVSLSAPFFVYGLAFLCIGIGPWVSYSARFYVQNLGAGFYTVASASGSLYFALNFGDEGGSKVQSWVFRACVIQGTQQIYIASLWYWGSALTHATAEGLDNTTSNSILGTFKITAITIPIVILLWIIGFVLSIGLPKYYRQAPGKVPAFYRSAMKRKIIKWFFVMAVVQNFFMSAPYGRNWTFLFSSQHVKPWQVLCLAALFFIGVWAGLLAYLAHLTKKHSWILPLFAIGLGTPRFAQIWWGTSNIGLYLPWAGTYAAGAMVSRALWLWLGVLDAIQGVGLGMMMLGTLTRMHVAFAVMATQCVGSIATILARAVAPNRIGPGPISPDLSGGIGALWTAWFWVALAANLLLCVGFYKFYRKEQLQKP